jgi:hypothetical protein
MSKGRLLQFLWMAALVPLFGASVLPTQMRALVCRLSGALMDEETCCPLGDEKQAAAVAQMLDQGCCVLKTVELPKLLSDHQADGPAQCDSQPLWSTLTSELLPPETVGLPLHRVRPPPLGPPLRLLKRSFLI